jgi:hypothetical protein
MYIIAIIDWRLFRELCRSKQSSSNVSTKLFPTIKLLTILSFGRSGKGLSDIQLLLDHVNSSFYMRFYSAICFSLIQSTISECSTLFIIFLPKNGSIDPKHRRIGTFFIHQVVGLKEQVDAHNTFLVYKIQNFFSIK